MLTKKQKRLSIFVLFLIVVGSFLETLGVTALLPVIESLLKPEKILNKWYMKPIVWICGEADQKTMTIALCVAVIVIYFVKNIYMYLATVYQSKYRGDIQKHLSIKMLRSYMSWPYEDFSSLNTAKITQGIDTDVVGVYNLLDNFFRFISEFLTATLIGIFILVTDVAMSLAVIAIAAICFLIITFGFKRRVGDLGERRRIAFTRRMGVAYQSIGGFKEIRVSETMDHFIDEYAEATEGQRVVELGNDFILFLPERLIEAMCVGCMFAVLCVKMYLGQDMTDFVPKLGVFAMAAFRLLPSVSRMTRYMSGIFFQKPYMENAYKYMREIDDYEAKNANRITVGNSEDEIKDLQFNEKLEVKDVTFSYETSDDLKCITAGDDGEVVKKEPRIILSNLNMTVNKGESIGLIGPSGAGKTTLADIILGLLYPGENHIMLDGHDVYKSKKAWSKLIGYVPQNVFLADTNIRENVAFGIDKDKIDDAKVWKALEDAQLVDYVKSLPEGLDTEVGERGIKFSGGQRQRIAIARVMYKNPEIIVFDEATSALDNDTEKAVMESIDSLSGTKTLIIVAHRLTTIKNCDHIYEISEGKAKLRDKDSL